jgi:hypothetical protein
MPSTYNIFKIATVHIFFVAHFQFVPIHPPTQVSDSNRCIGKSLNPWKEREQDMWQALQPRVGTFGSQPHRSFRPNSCSPWCKTSCRSFRPDSCSSRCNPSYCSFRRCIGSPWCKRPFCSFRRYNCSSRCKLSGCRLRRSRCIHHRHRGRILFHHSNTCQCSCRRHNLLQVSCLNRSEERSNNLRLGKNSLRRRGLCYIHRLRNGRRLRRRAYCSLLPDSHTRKWWCTPCQ